MSKYAVVVALCVASAAARVVETGPSAHHKQHHTYDVDENTLPNTIAKQRASQASQAAGAASRSRRAENTAMTANAGAFDENTYRSPAANWFSAPSDWSLGDFPRYPETAVAAQGMDADLAGSQQHHQSAAQLRVSDVLTVTDTTLDIGPTECWEQTQRVVRGATASQDTVCVDKLGSCGATEWETHPTTATSHRVCKAHKVCDPETEKETTPAGTHHDRACTKKIHCELNAWGPWSTCSKPCLGLDGVQGTQTRHRTVKHHPEFNGDQCPHLQETANCNTSCCKESANADNQSQAAGQAYTVASVRLDYNTVVEAVGVTAHFANSPAMPTAEQLCAGRQGFGVCSDGEIAESKIAFAEDIVAYCCGERSAPRCEACDASVGAFSCWEGMGTCPQCAAFQKKVGCTCVNCPFGYKGAPDHSHCFPWKCTHVTCRHIVHKCHRFNTDPATRATKGEGGVPAAAVLSREPRGGSSAAEECNGIKQYKTTVVHHSTTTSHSLDEQVCHEGHWCAMGAVTGDTDQCECAPLSRRQASPGHAQSPIFADLMKARAGANPTKHDLATPEDQLSKDGVQKGVYPESSCCPHCEACKYPAPVNDDSRRLEEAVHYVEGATVDDDSRRLEEAVHYVEGATVDDDSRRLEEAVHYVEGAT
eukprot:g1518.t1